MSNDTPTVEKPAEGEQPTAGRKAFRAAGGRDHPDHRRDRDRAQDRLRPINSGRHLRDRADLPHRHRRRPHGESRHVADLAQLPVAAAM